MIGVPIAYKLVDGKRKPRVYVNAASISSNGTDVSLIFGEYEPLTGEEVAALPEGVCVFPEKVRLVVTLEFARTLAEHILRAVQGNEHAREQHNGPKN